MTYELSESQVEKFNKDGFLIVDNFISSDDCKVMQEQCRHLIDRDLDLKDHPLTVFSTIKQTNDDYFMNSADKIRFFFENGVIDAKGHLLREKHLSINKIGHALHALDPVFRKVTHLPQVQGAAKSLGLTKPIIPQSMCIFKQPGVGGAVVPHQDAQFLHTIPSRIVGFWIAIEDADGENGCLSFIPGSHKWPVRRKMVRTANANKTDAATTFVGEEPTYDLSAFIDTPVKRGSCVMIHDHVVHKSEKNTSNRSRLIYTFHVAESLDTEWSKENWLQPTATYEFPLLYQ